MPDSRLPVGRERARPDCSGRAKRQLIFAGQHDHVAGEIEGDLIEREIGELDFLAEDDGGIAVLAGKRDHEPPELEGLSSNFAEVLREGDFIEEPVGSARLRDMLNTIGVKHVAVQAVAVPLFGAGELAKIGFGECFL